MCDGCREIFDQERAARIFRVMRAYTHLVEAFDAFAGELDRELNLVADFGESPMATKDTINATQQALNKLGTVRDGFAQMAATIGGDNRFKTGEIHRLYDQACEILNTPDADTETIASAVIALLPAD